MKQILDNEAFDYFCIYPSAKLGIRALAKAMHCSPTQASRLVKPLIKKKILSCEVMGRTKVITANTQNEEFFTYKKWNNLFLLIKAGIVEEFQRHHIASVVLFGSYCRGQDTERSDIDIGVSEKKAFSFSTIEDRLHRKMNIHLISELKPTVLENVRQGIVIWGHMP